MTKPSTPRVKRSAAELRERGGRVTSIWLSPEAVRRIALMVASGRAKDQTDAIDRALEIAEHSK